MTRLYDYYTNTVVNQLRDRYSYKNFNQTPKVEKIVLNMGLGDAKENPKKLEALRRDLTLIAGQAAVVTRARVSVSNFKLREGYPVGLKVTLRRRRMWEFLDRLICFAVPRIRDFRGLSVKGFDGRGNYAFGLTEHIVFPEVNTDRVDHIHGLDVCLVTSAATDAEGLELLRLLGFPFRQREVVRVGITEEF